MAVWPELVSSPGHAEELELLGVFAQRGIRILEVDALVARYLQEEVLVHKILGACSLYKVHVDCARI